MHIFWLNKLVWGTLSYYRKDWNDEKKKVICMKMFITILLLKAEEKIRNTNS